MLITKREDKREEYSDNQEYGREIDSRVVKAGSRTYFFDIKATRTDEYYLTFTESKRRTRADGTVFYDKHKIFLYREDLVNILDTFSDCVEYILTEQPAVSRDKQHWDEDNGREDEYDEE
ncbi:MAG: PUR family DNA/RNA-binding protein [Bacteroidales bacterium]|jgi:hypothetical protein|nr:PUR family DNA/RNA-binding protein [Bacteroidales bacterium]